MILYFSGTGNSRYAAEFIAGELGDEIVSINEYMKAGCDGTFTSDRPYVIVCPTYAWRIPLVVEKWLKSAHFAGSKDMYFILTCGDSTCGAQGYAKKLCSEIEMNFRGFKTVIMPENYIALFDVPDKAQSERIVNAASKPLKAAAKIIAKGDDLQEKVSAFGPIMSSIVNKVFFTFIVKDKGFHLEKDCISCGKCAELCPLNNIKLINGKPVWHGNCTHCMACICGCPSECIEYKKSSQKRRKYWFGK